SPRISPQKEITTQRRKLRLNEEAKESEESAPNSPTLPGNLEEQKDEELKEREEEEKETEEAATETSQDMETQFPNLEDIVPKQQWSRRASGEHIPPAMGYAKDT
ncbi:hypothetical protein KI387_035315, partial [Taxus chinensis]